MRFLLPTCLKNTLRTLLIFVTASGGAASMRAQCPVNAAFNHSQTYVCTGTNITFNNTTTGGAIAQQWFENITPFSTQLSPTRTFNAQGGYVISLIATNGSCADTAQSAVWVSPTMTASAVGTNPTCFNGTNGSVNLTPGGGTPNISLNNNRSISDYTAANTVSAAGYAGGITLEAWVKPRSTWTTGDGLFFAFNQTTGTGNRFFVGYNAGLQQFVYFDDNLGNQFFNGIQPRNAWYHIAVTITSGNVVNLYLNGVLNRTVTTNANWVPQAGDRFNMGQEWDFNVLSQHFDGWIDEARVWNAVLSGPTILSNRNSCMGINSSHPNWGNIVAYYSFNEGSGTYLFDRSGKNNHGQRVNGSTYGTPAETNWGCFSDGTGYGYAWSTGATTQDISGVGAGTYNVTVMDGAGAGCPATASATLTNPAQVVVSITPPGPIQICAGGSTPLAASGANTYAWSPGTGLSATTGANVTATPSSTITYTCTGTNLVGCTGQSTVQVVVNPNPTATITGNTTICLGQSTTLTGGGGTSYQWSNGAVTPANPVSPTITTTYTVTATNTFGCTDTEVATVTVNPLPTVAVTGDTVLCLGDTTTLVASGGTGFSWSNGPTTAANTITPGSTTTYTVTVTDANTCSNSRPVTVTVNPLPTVAITGDDTICVGDTTTLTANGGTVYAWSNGPTTAGNTVNPTSTTSYTVTVTDANTCRNTASQSVVVNALPLLSFTGQDTVCNGDTTQITVSGGSSYVWTHGPTTALVDLSPIVNTYYSVVATDSNGCSNTDSIQILVNALPAVTITGIDSICLGDSTLLTAGGANTYAWNTGSTNTAISVGPSTSTSYTVTGTDGNGCENSASTTVVVNALPTPTITGDTVVCDGDSTTLTASGGSTYFWDIFAAGPSITVAPATSTVYSVTATDANGCEGTASATVTVNALPAVPTISQSGNSLSVPTGYASYQWFLNGTAVPGATSDTYTGSTSGTVSVVVTNAAGCEVESADYLFVSINPVGTLGFDVAIYPNPNNGQFTLRLDLERDREVGLRIFDLAGHQVWSADTELRSGEWKQSVDLSNLSRGTYLLEISSEGQKAAQRIVVQ